MFKKLFVCLTAIALVFGSAFVNVEGNTVSAKEKGADQSSSNILVSLWNVLTGKNDEGQEGTENDDENENIGNDLVYEPIIERSADGKSITVSWDEPDYPNYDGVNVYLRASDGEYDEPDFVDPGVGAHTFTDLEATKDYVIQLGFVFGGAEILGNEYTVAAPNNGDNQPGDGNKDGNSDGKQPDHNDGSNDDAKRPDDGNRSGGNVAPPVHDGTNDDSRKADKDDNLDDAVATGGKNSTPIKTKIQNGQTDDEKRADDGKKAGDEQTDQKDSKNQKSDVDNPKVPKTGDGSESGTWIKALIVFPLIVALMAIQFIRKRKGNVLANVFTES